MILRHGERPLNFEDLYNDRHAQQFVKAPGKASQIGPA
jgi:hypothetical protein